jgi:hypothetical protein
MLNKVVIILLSLFLFSTVVNANTSIGCLDDFFTKYEKLKGYKVQMQKNENFHLASVSNNELIEVEHVKNEFLNYKYLSDGKTGIKNNGMVVTYRGTPKLQVKYGKPSFIGHFANFIARNLYKSFDIYDPQVLKNEIFSVNRAGFDFIYLALKYHYDGLKSAKSGGLILATNDSCELKYSPHNDRIDDVEINDKMTVSQLEEMYGIPGIFIYLYNTEKFSSYIDFYQLKNIKKLKIPRYFMPFRLVLDHEGYPQLFEIQFADKIIAEYRFSNLIKYE